MKRKSPLFFIDRDKLGDYPFNYITCLDKEVGFVAKITIEPEKNKQTVDDYITKAKELLNFEELFHISFKNGRIIVLEIVEFIHSFEWNTDRRNRVRVLLKKAMKKFISTTFIVEPSGESMNINEQIKAQELTLKRAKQYWTELVARGTEEEARYSYELNEAILQSLKNLKKLYELN